MTRKVGRNGKHAFTKKSAAHIEFEAVRSEATRKAESWANSVAVGPLPIPIHELALACKVKSLQFRLLISTAALKKRQDGYAIVVNVLANGVDQVEGTEITPNQEWSRLRAPVRFSIAHELAHILFYDAVGGQTDNELLSQNWNEVEKACNQMAAIMLLPKERLMRELGKTVFDNEHVSSVARRFGVSRETILRRLEHKEIRRRIQDVDGIICLVRRKGTEFELVAPHIRGEKASARFRANDESKLESLRLPSRIDSLIRAGVAVRERVRVDWRENEYIECEIWFSPGRLQNHMGILTVSSLGSPIRLGRL